MYCEILVYFRLTTDILKVCGSMSFSIFYAASKPQIATNRRDYRTNVTKFGSGILWTDRQK